MTLRLGVDARPLLYPNTGIGQYTTQLLNRMTTNAELELYLYANAPLTNSWPHKIRYCRPRFRVPSSLAAQLLYPKWARQDKIDVFWSPRHHLPLRIKTPTVVTIHDLVWCKVPESMRRFGYLLDRSLMPASARTAKEILCVSAATRNDLICLDTSLADKVTVTHLASRFENSNTSTPQSTPPYVLHVGTQEPRKNVYRLINAFKCAIRELNTSHHLVLAGGSGWKEDYRRYLTDPLLDGRIHLHEHPSDSDLKQLYAGCDFLALPSLYEGFGLPIVEAMGFGRPILTSNCSAMPEIAGDAAVYVNPYATNDITEALKRLMSDSELKAQLSANALARSSLFSWTTTYMQTLCAIKRAAQSRQA